MKLKQNRIYTSFLKPKISRAVSLLLLVALVSVLVSGCQKKTDEAAVSDAEKPTHDFQGDSPDKGATAADLYCVEFCSYSGQFMEDNTFENVENVAAMWLENRSREFLDMATITYDTEDGKEAVFEVKGLPPKEKVLVLEKNRMVLTGKEKFEEYPEVTVSFNKYAIMKTDDIAVTEKDGVLAVTNMSGKNLKNVAIYYKLLDAEGNFLGGAAYLSSIGDLKPQETKEKDAPLFSQNAKIVRYSYQAG